MPSQKRIVIIGGSAAGIEAAARAYNLNDSIEITLLQTGKADEELADFLPDNNPKYWFKYPAINRIENVQVTAIRLEEHAIEYADESGKNTKLEYHKLIIATGAEPKTLSCKGAELTGVVSFRGGVKPDGKSIAGVVPRRKPRMLKTDMASIVNLGDNMFGSQNTDPIDVYFEDFAPEPPSVAVIGCGHYGLETALAFQLAGAKVTIVEKERRILNFLDEEISALAEKCLSKMGMEIITGCEPTEFTGSDGKLTGVTLSNGKTIPCVTACCCIGLSPNVSLAAAAGLTIGEQGGILVNQFMQTSDFDIYACGTCTETRSIISGGNVYAHSANTERLQGQAAGENAVVGNKFMITGTTGNYIAGFPDLSVGCTGMSEEAAQTIDYETDSVIWAGDSHDGGSIVIKMVIEKLTERILGAQCIGSGDISRQLAIIAMAEKGGMDITDLSGADLSSGDLTFSSTFPVADACTEAARLLYNKKWNFVKTISPKAFAAKLAGGDPVFIADVRLKNVFEKGSLENAVNIPLCKIKDKLAEFPQDKKVQTICVSGTGAAAFDAARVLMQNGVHNVRVLEGGLLAWPATCLGNAHDE